MPLHQVCLQLEAVNQPEAFASVEVKRVVVGLMRDLRGICSSCANKRTYTLFFEWLFPAHMELMRRCVPTVTCPLPWPRLKPVPTVQELCSTDLRQQMVFSPSCRFASSFHALCHPGRVPRIRNVMPLLPPVP